MKKLFTLFALSGAVFMAGCSTTQLQKLQTFSTNYQAAVVAINADIAASAPLVAKGCGDLQTAAMLLAPLVPTNAKAPQYFAAANAALTAYCQAIPTDINSTVVAVTKAVQAAQTGYNQAVGK